MRDRSMDMRTDGHMQFEVFMFVGSRVCLRVRAALALFLGGSLARAVRPSGAVASPGPPVWNRGPPTFVGRALSASRLSRKCKLPGWKDGAALVLVCG